LYGGVYDLREHEQVKEFAVDDIIRLVRQTDLSDINTFLVLNGGTGVGKTTAIMNNVLKELDHKFGRLQTMLVVESRSITVE
jgi:CRISPR/Cas system-associated endonuclease/helicase Cas3